MFGKKKRKKIIALIDFENISRHAVDQGKIIDFKKLHQLLSEFGEIVFAFVFIPDHYVYSLPDDLNNLGFEIILCQKMKDDSDKLEDTVDINIIQTGMKFCLFDEITDIVMVGHDRHMTYLIKEAKNRKKVASVIGTEKISSILKQVVDIKNIYDLPLE
ncbi:MAG: NYN domain-containing protein [Candidatus Terrybacteria bacterium]|nr:NYN domain-containing protein [Candidatus Terrybacteria bacterium]